MSQNIIRAITKSHAVPAAKRLGYTQQSQVDNVYVFCVTRLSSFLTTATMPCRLPHMTVHRGWRRKVEHTCVQRNSCIFHFFCAILYTGQANGIYAKF